MTCWWGQSSGQQHWLIGKILPGHAPYAQDSPLLQHVGSSKIKLTLGTQEEHRIARLSSRLCVRSLTVSPSCLPVPNKMQHFEGTLCATFSPQLSSCPWGRCQGCDCECHGDMALVQQQPCALLSTVTAQKHGPCDTPCLSGRIAFSFWSLKMVDTGTLPLISGCRSSNTVKAPSPHPLCCWSRVGDAMGNQPGLWR